VVLKGGDGCSVYIPSGCAHGFQTLSENVLLSYMMSCRHDPERAAGVHWLDRKLKIKWPNCDPAQIVISRKDAALPNFEEAEI